MSTTTEVPGVGSKALFAVSQNEFMSKTLVWQQDAAREIIDALREERERVAYYASGQGDGWARSYGAGNFSHPDYAAIIAKHYKAAKSK